MVNAPKIDGLANADRHFLTDEISPYVFSAEYLMAIALSVGRGKDRVRLENFYRNKAYDSAILAPILKKHNLGEKWDDLLRLFSGGSPLYHPEK